MPPVSAEEPLGDARTSFYSARYDEAAAMTLDRCATGDFEACEVRSSALHFEIKRLMGDAKDRDKAFETCERCPALLDAFMQDNGRGQTAARARLKANDDDEAALYFLGKLDLNYVWLQAGTLGKKTGWSEYWEARKSLDAVLKAHPDNIRAKVARAWIDYIVDTRMPRGTRWIMGGGSKKKALAALREASQADTDFYARAEARFGLWDMLAREKRYAEAVEVARELVKDFPENTDLPKFIQAHDPH
jgi:tetratricopeptide (TPR) repeat protein